MKRWPLIASFVLFIALCATLAYWAMQFFKPPTRPVAAPPPSAQAPVNIDAAATLFGGRGSAAVASNFQLKGVIMASNPKDSVVILAADGKPAQAVRAGTEISPGVKIKEVNRRFVVLSDNGVEKRVELPEENRLALGSEGANAAPVPTTSLPPRPAPAMPATVVNNPEPDSESDTNRQAPSAADSDNDTNAPTNTAPAQQQPATSAGANAAAGQSGASPQGARPAAVAPTLQAPAPGSAGMGSPPITNQGSLAGSSQGPTPPAARVVPGMPVTPAPPRR